MNSYKSRARYEGPTKAVAVGPSHKNAHKFLYVIQAQTILS